MRGTSEYRATLVTHHGKGGVIAPLLQSAGWTVDVLDRDTDALGTFSGDVERRGSPRDVAITKALLASGESAAPWFLASEGSLTRDPWGLARDHELVVLVHAASRVTLVGEALSHDVVLVGEEVNSEWSDSRLDDLCARADLGRHHLMVVSVTHDVPARGGLARRVEVETALREMSAPGRRLRIQSDCRAHLSASRREVIGAATRDLIRKLSSTCPSCAGVGFSPVEAVEGLRCSQCYLPTREPRAHLWACPWCDFRRETLVEATVDPSRCPWCNP